MIRRPVEISVMTVEDIDEILLVENSSFDNPWSRDTFIRELQLPVSRSLVAKIRRDTFCEIAGYIVYWTFAREVHIHKIAVKENLRRCGVASELMAEMIRRSCEAGALYCTLEVGSSNEKAQKLYEKFGFSITAVRHRYYSESGEDAVVMLAEIEKCMEFLLREG